MGQSCTEITYTHACTKRRSIHNDHFNSSYFILPKTFLVHKKNEMTNLSDGKHSQQQTIKQVITYLSLFAVDSMQLSIRECKSNKMIAISNYTQKQLQLNSNVQ